MDAEPVDDAVKHCIQFQTSNAEMLQASVKPGSSMPRAENLAWIFSDKAGLRQRLLQELNFRTVHFHYDLHSRSQCQKLLNELALQKPMLLWIRFAGPCAGSGNRQDALRAEHLVRIINEHKHAGGIVVIEASERSQVWNLQAVKECMHSLHATVHQWCRYERSLSAGEKPCSSKVKLLTNFQVPDASECRCGLIEHARFRELGSRANVRFENVLRSLMQLVCLHHADLGDRMSLQMPAKGQPESQDIVPLIEDINVDKHGVKKTVRFGSMYPTHSVQPFHKPPPNLPPSSELQHDFWISSGKQCLIRVHVNPRNQMFVPTDVECPVAVNTLLSKRQTKMQQCFAITTGTDPQQLLIEDDWRSTTKTDINFHWVGTTTFTASACEHQSYPTENAIRQKQKKSEGHVVKPRKKVVEQHQDDCGENFDLLKVNNPEALKQEHFYEEQDLFEHICFAVGSPYGQYFGSEAEHLPQSWLTATSFVTVASVYHQRSQFEVDDAGIDCMELFGGSGTTTFLLFKYYGMKTGVNFELMCGIDLTKGEDIHYLFAYIRRNKPKVIILAPPCKGFSKWGHLNQKINHDAWVKSRQLSVPLARLSGDVAIEQVSSNRHFLVEQPLASGLHDEPQWKQLKSMMSSVVFDQCMTGLRMSKSPWWPVRKPTECKASHPSLLTHLYNLRCDGTHQHAHIGSWSCDGRPTVRSIDMQVWPRELCERIAAGVVECIFLMMVKQPGYFAAAKRKTVAESPTYTCPACRSHLRKTDARHTRDDTCRFRDVKSISWSCPGCVAKRHRAHESHTNDDTCQWALARSMPEGASRERGPTHPRDGRIPASSDPTARLRMDGRADGVPGAEHRTEGDPSHRTRSGPSSDSRAARRVDAEVQVETPGAASGSADGAVVIPAEGERGIAEAEIPAWSRHDLGFALQQLRSIRAGVVRRTLRKLHIRWYHAGAKKMQTLLQAAGVSPDILLMIPSIVDTCDICRNWQRVGPRTVASTRLPETFNKEIQMDLLFYKDHVLLHCIDACTRWSAVHKLSNREPSSIVDGFAACWLRLFGPPAVVLSDQEGGLMSDLAGEWFDKRGIQLLFRAREQHCGMVERHNEILRRQLHVLEDQSNAEGLAIPFTTILSEAVFAKNAMFQCGNATPYEAVFGRTPPLLATIGEESGEGITDRDAARIRQLAVNSMLQATADQKTRLADRSKTRRAGELLELRIGDLVDFYRKPMTKDITGWHGPAEVVSLSSLQDGLLYIKWQGRVLAARIQDVRSAMIFATFLMRVSEPIRTFRAEVESQCGHALRLGWMRQGGNWVQCQANRSHSTLLAVGLYVSAVCMNLQGVIGFRCGTELNNLPAVAFDDTLLLWWNANSDGPSDWYHCFLPGNQLLNVPKLTGSVGAAVSQFFMVDMTEVMSLRQVVPDIPHLGGLYEPSMPSTTDMTDEVLKSRGPKPLTNQSRVPTEQIGSADLDANNDVPTSENLLVSQNSQIDSPSYKFDYISLISDIAFLGTVHSGTPPNPEYPTLVDVPFSIDADELVEQPVFSFASTMAQFIILHGKQIQSKLSKDQMLSFVHTEGASPVAVIERTNNILNREEALLHVEECRESMILELMRWIKHSAWKRGDARNATNILKSKWVLKWKDISDGSQKVRKIKARLVAQGFLDKQATDTFAGTSTRWGQRLLIAIAVQRGWALWSANISEAFLRGLTFDELHQEGGALRQVEISLPPGGEHLLRVIKGYEDFDPQREVLVMLKPGFGLKDAPRLWLMALKRVLAKIGVIATQVDSQLFCMHQKGNLVLMMTIHVDDIKMCGDPDLMKSVVSQLESNFDSVKLEKNNFVHLGLEHALQEDGSITVSQSHYISELRHIPEDQLKTMEKDALVDEHYRQLFMSLLGGVAWIVQTRLDVAVYVGALQRKLQKPCAQDLLNLNRLVTYIKNKPLVMTFKRLTNPWRLVAISDSSFKGEDQDCLAIRSGLICLVDKDFPKLGANDIQIVEYVSKKQSRVCRSTYAAELYSALDLSGLLFNIALTLCEVLEGTTSASILAERFENGKLTLGTDLVIDAAAVFDHIAAHEAKVPHDASMTIHSLKARELLSDGKLQRMIWCDTRSMLADGLNKGTIDRAALQCAVSQGRWTIDQPVRIHGLQMPKAELGQGQPESKGVA